MRLRFRKSINLGGGFRINISKSGIGYSWGVKGFRVTKTANGRIRTTSSIPGTGISYSKEYGRNQSTPSNIPSFDENHYGTKNIANENISDIYSAEFEDIIKIAKHKLAFNKFLNFLLIVSFFAFGISSGELTEYYEIPKYYPICSSIVFAISVIAKILLMTVGRIKLEYEIDNESQQIINERSRPLINASKSERIFRVLQTSKVINKKYEAGANETITTKKCKITMNTPFPFKANLPAPTFKMGKEKIAFLPDKLLIIKGIKIGIVNYTDINVSSGTMRYIEHQRVPKDTEIVGYTWKYVNKSGGPDRRFGNNPQYPICLYGELTLKSDSGLNTVIEYSNGNPSIVENLNNLNKPFSYFEISNTKTENRQNNTDYDIIPNNDDSEPKKHPLRKSMMFWCILSLAWGLFIAADAVFLFSQSQSDIANMGLILLIPPFSLAYMFYILAKSPKNNRYILGREFGMTKSVFVVIMVIAMLFVFYSILFVYFIGIGIIKF